MNDLERKEESWIGKLPKIILVLAALIFIIVVIRDHSQYKKWREERSDLTGKLEQTGEELALLKNANGVLDDVTKKTASLEQQAAALSVALEKLTEEKNAAENTLEKLRQELSDLNWQIFTGRNKFTELMQENENLKTTNQQLRSDIVNKKSVQDSIVFLQRQKPDLEQDIRELQTRYELAVKEESAQQARLETLQKEIQEREAEIQALNERHTELSSKVGELTETVENLSLQKDKLEMWDDSQKKLEYIEYLQQQKESLEMSINSLLEKGRKLEAGKPESQQNEPTR